jgi:hypothetical protein
MVNQMKGNPFEKILGEKPAPIIVEEKKLNWLLDDEEILCEKAKKESTLLSR